MLKLTPLEEQLKQYAPAMFIIHMLMKDEIDGGGGERHLTKLIDAIVSYNQSGATGKIDIVYSRGKISDIYSTLKLVHGGLPKNREE